MIVSRRWLEALLGRMLTGQDVADRLARQVAPVDGVVPIHQDLRDVLIARVLEVKQHPNADRLSLCQVDAGGGAPLEAIPIGDEQIIIDVSANRPDLLCHKGVARELAVSLGATVKLPEIPVGTTARRHDSSRATRATRADVDGVEVRLEDPEGAPRYMTAVIRGVKVQPSPAWLATRLQSVGQRPINNIVDATNYILFELNQPLHAFDLAKLRGPAVVVRRAKPGEPIVTLDG